MDYAYIEYMINFLINNPWAEFCVICILDCMMISYDCPNICIKQVFIARYAIKFLCGESEIKLLLALIHN